MTRQLMKRYIILIVGLFLMGLGTALVTKANIGPPLLPAYRMC